jgi:ATP-binding cassette subfamily F protein 3
VSHDRLFLDNTVNRIAEVAHQQLYHYKGNFSEYLEQKEERDEMLQRRFDNQQDYIRQQMAFIRRFKAKASKATAVQSRVKMLQKMEKIELKDDEKREMNIRFNIRTTPGKTICTLKDVSKSYDDTEIIRSANAQVLRGDKIALIGANGKGKSTLLRIIFGSEPHGGEVEPGWNVETSFFAQHQLEALNLQRDLLNELGTVDAEYTEAELRTVLGCFLFTGDEVFKKIKVLSGGEKSRVALAKTLLTRANLLLLDEPTNHLDMFSTSVLADAISQYKGTCVIVSHDRTFVSNVATKIWWIENGMLREYPGTYDEWNEWMQRRGPETYLQEPSQSKPKSTDSKGQDNVSAEPKKPGKNRMLQLEQEMADLEKQMEAVRAEKAMHEQRLTDEDVAVDFDKINTHTQAYQKAETQLKELQNAYDAVMEQWIAGTE